MKSGCKALCPPKSHDLSIPIVWRIPKINIWKKNLRKLKIKQKTTLKLVKIIPLERLNGCIFKIRSDYAIETSINLGKFGTMILKVSKKLPILKNYPPLLPVDNLSRVSGESSYWPRWQQGEVLKLSWWKARNMNG